MKTRKLLFIVCALALALALASCTKYTETFKGENLQAFPEVRNIVDFLQINPKNVIILSETERELMFCFKSFESEINGSEYTWALMDEGYELDGSDGTIISVTKLSKGDIYIEKTCFSPEAYADGEYTFPYGADILAKTRGADMIFHIRRV